MTLGRLATPLFTVVARTARGRDELTRERLYSLVRTWVPSSSADVWWMDPVAGVAIYRPELSVDGDGPMRRAALSVRGVIVGGGRSDPPAAWSELPGGSGSALVLYDLLERDVSALRDLRGQFVIAQWDGRRQRLLLARDHLGQRALFIRTEPDRIVFCSELAPLLRGDAAACDIDFESAFWYLAFGRSVPGATLARGVTRLPAAHAILWEPGGTLQLVRYWTPLSNEAPRTATPDYVAAVRAAMNHAVAAHVDAGAPSAVLLSGGVDSTFVSATATMLGARPSAAYTVAFEDAHGANENEYSHAVAEWLGIPHHIVTLYAEEALELLDDVVFAAAEPCSAWATLSHFRLLAAAAERGTTRMLSGLGADEIFGGYDHFRGYYARLLRYTTRFPPPDGVDSLDSIIASERQVARRTLYPGIARFFDDASLRRGLLPPYCTWHYASHLREFYRECRRLKPEAQPMELMVAHECQHRIPDLLFANFEPVSRRVGVEVAYPFLDPDVVTLAAGLDVTSRYRTPSGRFSLRFSAIQPRFKHALMLAAADRVPTAIRARSRKSLTLPFGGWLFTPPFGERVVRQLRSSRIWDRGLVQRDWLDTILAGVAPGPNRWVFQLWALVTLARWYDRYVEAPRAP